MAVGTVMIVYKGFGISPCLPYRISKRPVWQAKTARSALRNGPFCIVIRAVLQRAEGQDVARHDPDIEIILHILAAANWLAWRLDCAPFAPAAHSLSGFQPCAFSSNSAPSRATSTRPRLSLVMWPMSFTSSMAFTLSRSPIGTVNSSS